MNKPKQEAIDRWTKWFIEVTNGSITDHKMKLHVNQHVRLALVGLAVDLEPIEPVKPLRSETGCWFCGVDDEDLVYENESHVFVHIDCVRTALHLNPLDPEANSMKHIFKPL